MSIPGAASPLFLGAAVAEAAAYQIDRSLRFDEDATAFLERTPSSAGNRRTWTWSGWVKRSSDGNNMLLLAYQASPYLDTGILFNSSDEIYVYNYDSGGFNGQVTTNAVFRDYSAWYHIVVVFDTTNATPVKIYVNGEQQSTKGTQPSSNSESVVNYTTSHKIGRYEGSTTYSLDGYLADVHFIDGQALAPTDFGEYDDNNVWQPKEYTFVTNPNDGTTYSSDISGTVLSGSAANVFDGSLATQAEPDSLLTYSPSTTITAQSQIRLYIFQNGYVSQYGTFEHNGTNISSSIASQLGDGVAGWITLSSNTITQLKWSRDSGVGSWRLRAIEVDGYVLIDGAGDNSFHLDFSDNSSNAALGDDSSGNNNDWTVNNISSVVGNGNYVPNVTPSSSWYSSSNNAVQMFDGDTSTEATTTGAGSSITWAVSSNSLTGTIEYYIGGSTYVQHDGSTVATGPGSGYAWTTGVSINSVSSVTFYRSGSTPLVRAVRLNGDLLIDYRATSANDSLIDTPTNYEASSGNNNGGNYATLNPLANGGGTLADGNLYLSGPASSWGSRISTIGVSSGKWYFEATPLSGSSAQGIMFGVSLNTSPSSYLGSESTTYSYYGANGNKYNSNSNSAYGAVVADNDIVGVALDLDAGTLTFYKNNASQGTAFSGLPSGTYYLGISCYGTATAVVNFGQRPFAYTPPTGFLPLVTTSLPDPTIADGSTAMDAKLYLGNGTADGVTQTITGLSMSPDLVWIKSRSNAYAHNLYDVVRGAGKALVSNATTSETTTNALTEFTSDGFTVKRVDSGPYYETNANNATYVAWAWDGGTTTATNTDGSITSNVRANQSAGFSIVKWDATSSAETVGHGLNAAPEFILMKTINTTGPWLIYHKDVGASKYMDFTTAAPSTNNLVYTTAPTSSVFSPGNGIVNTSIYDEMIAYCFAPVEGYSAFGTVLGTGSSNGGFAYTGFRPRFLLYRNADATGSWGLYDSERDPDNIAEELLFPNLNNAEQTFGEFDLLSNGIKLRYNYTSGHRLVFAAFSEHPFKTARAR